MTPALRSDLVVEGVLPLSGERFRIAPLTFLGALQAEARTRDDQAPSGVEPSTWSGVVELAHHLEQLGEWAVVSPQQLLELHEGDAGALLDAYQELKRREARFRAARQTSGPRGGVGGTGDGLDGGGDPVAASVGP